MFSFKLINSLLKLKEGENINYLTIDISTDYIDYYLLNLHSLNYLIARRKKLNAKKNIDNNLRYEYKPQEFLKAVKAIITECLDEYNVQGVVFSTPMFGFYYLIKIIKQLLLIFPVRTKILMV